MVTISSSWHLLSSLECILYHVNTARFPFTVEDIIHHSFAKKNNFLLLTLVLYSAYLLIKHFKMPVQ